MVGIIFGLQIAALMPRQGSIKAVPGFVSTYLPKSLVHTARRTSSSEQGLQATETHNILYISPEDINKTISYICIYLSLFCLLL